MPAGDRVRVHAPELFGPCKASDVPDRADDDGSGASVALIDRQPDRASEPAAGDGSGRSTGIRTARPCWSVQATAATSMPGMTQLVDTTGLVHGRELAEVTTDPAFMC